jgi:hypothetical protein
MGIENIENREKFENKVENRENFENKVENNFENEEFVENKNENIKTEEIISLKDKVLLEKQETINDILEFGLVENYSKLSEEKKKEFKEEGEKLILDIFFIMDKDMEKTFIKSPEEILEKIQKWLISGFANNPYSIQQSKIIFDSLKNKFYK